MDLIAGILGQIGTFFLRLFDTEGFPARWNCGSAWAEDPWVGWLHIVSDYAIFGAYLAIPIVLGYFLYKRREFPFPYLTVLFAVFILSCGFGHAVEATIFWTPVYRLSGLIKLVTAVVSWGTFVAMIPMIPQILNIPNLQQLNQRMSNEIDERKKAEAFFRTTFESASTGIVIVDEEGMVKNLNPVAVAYFGYSMEEICGKPVEVLIPQDIRGRHVEYRTEYMQAPVQRMMGESRDLSGLKKDGSEFPVEVGLSPIIIGSERLILVTIVDITERKLTEAQLIDRANQLERSNKELDDFAYVASHDLRSPLQGINKLTSWVIEDNEGNLSDESQRHLDLLQSRISRLEGLLDDLLNYSRVGRVKNAIVEIDTKELVDSIFESLDRPESVQLETDTPLPTFQTFSAPLDLVFRNLLQNAIKHRDKDDLKITVRCVEKEDFYHFVVSDNGTGIDPKFHQKIFNIFETLKPRDEMEGSGIGLSIVQKAIKTVGGDIQIESQVGEGASFKFLWPKQIEKNGFQ